MEGVGRIAVQANLGKHKTLPEKKIIKAKIKDWNMTQMV
jgi:hypothetical protein